MSAPVRLSSWHGPISAIFGGIGLLALLQVFFFRNHLAPENLFGRDIDDELFTRFDQSMGLLDWLNADANQRGSEQSIAAHKMVMMLGRPSLPMQVTRKTEAG